MMYRIMGWIWDGVIRLVRLSGTIRRDLLILIMFVTLNECGVFPQFVKRGYYCDDMSIQRSFTGDTVSTNVIVLSGFVPLFLIWLTEIILYSTSSSSLCSSSYGQTPRCPSSWIQSWYWIKKYSKGLILKLLIMSVLKTVFCAHRPHFIETCLPDSVCKGSEFVPTYTCTNIDAHPSSIRDASKSFPSGHSSTSVYESIFLIWYWQKRIPKLTSVITLPLCQIVMATWGIFCPLSRIIDNRHHWWDVLVGAIIGVVAAGWTCYSSCHNFDRSRLMGRELIYKNHDTNIVSNKEPFLASSNGVNGRVKS
ncbi:putative phosphatidate phosphatase isoform X2 [Aedes aegypti]|uniref:Phosphatidic acid phosphatase type 2/haloperoxidase domain-containing protein n=1 Tax=Aedes aegypti TaxID=7159 RepID=A0A6I8TDV2_AEDAE|nr:putative phosphatidate phosphatase isoform X2 [Aedes aegypti]